MRRSALVSCAVASLIAIPAFAALAAVAPVQPSTTVQPNPAQPAPAPAPALGAQQTNAQRSLIYPPRPVDPAGVERGRVLYTENGCAACHGADTRGGTAPPLHRRSLVLNDVRGERVGPYLLNGGPPKSHPDFKHPTYRFEEPQIIDIADFLHSQRAIGTGTANIIRRVPSILTGSAPAGRAYFERTCSACHSATGDLAGIATRVADPKNLQQRWLSPPPTKPITAVVNAPGGRATGEVTAIDEFQVVLKTAAGERVIERNGARPAVVLTDPLAAHRALLGRITDKDIHDVTAYLVTLK